jgi:O-6-methylguanine DNA methyltransferase
MISSINLISYKNVPVFWAQDWYLLRLKDHQPHQLLWEKVPASFSQDSQFWSEELLTSLLEKPAFFPQEGSEFQMKVWRAIAQIRWGELRTYSELAQSIGTPRAVRAVARACGKNPLPLFIPCHRVVGKTDLGGFNGGVELKKKLLRIEGHPL